MRAKETRATARQALSGKWGLALATTLVASLLGVFGYSAYNNAGNGDLSDSALWESLQELLEGAARIPIVGIVTSILSAAMIWSIIRFLIGGSLELGYRSFTLHLVDHNEPAFGDLFSKISTMFAKGFLLQLLLDVFTFLWMLLFLIPGIIKLYSYSMASYIMTEHPEMRPIDAITASRKMMRGNKWRLFCLNLSFIWWILLCVLTLGIGFLWLNPYMQVANAAFYRELTQRQQAAEGC